MISDRDLPELKIYRGVEKNLPLKITPDVADLVVWGENERLPVHRWFRYKEAFSGRLLEYVLSSYRKTSGRMSLLDPFCGVGTSLLSAQLAPATFGSAFGIERNPFVAFVA